MSRIPDLPETVPLLEAEELCIGPYQIGDGCGCLAYWTDRVFLKGLRGEQHIRVETRIRQALKDELGIYMTTNRYTCQELANGWNRAMVNQLGYSVECDRSEWEREQKKVGTWLYE